MMLEKQKNDAELHVCQHLELGSLLGSLGPWQRAIAFGPVMSL